MARSMELTLNLSEEGEREPLPAPLLTRRPTGGSG
jgi:hypothetical protein